ncbi:hypothetical protein M3603_08225 [Rummeliibacillus stabekisii]|uniref:hypothetical protein n=1 Tax=Rummeliibacillus stabekisii TaxID=241244 RepID=UPI00203A9552|nr:hypothetical protein [Rummeliibacillus stabekisii]MCM3316662.1 hypothetical protein [Rummeliibacillus stabekisii]
MKVALSYSEGVVFNTSIQSTETEVGKSHLAMCILKSVNQFGNQEISSLFIDVVRTMELIKGSFNNNESIYKRIFHNSLWRSGFAFLDNLGAEKGDIYSTNHISEYISKCLEAFSMQKNIKLPLSLQSSQVRDYQTSPYKRDVSLI